MQAAWFVGVDWGSQKHQVCVTDAAGAVLGERAFEHGGAGLSEMADWLLSFAAGGGGAGGGGGGGAGGGVWAWRWRRRAGRWSRA